MAKIAWSTVVDHTSDTGFRAWGSELSAKLAAAGLVQTSDTGQINWGTATRPATLTYAGYEIWRFDDSLQATVPIFIKIEYGTSNGASTPAIRVTVGSATNGAGVLTGIVSTARVMNSGSTMAAGSTTTNWQSYAVHTAGFFGLAWKINAGGGSVAPFGFTIQRSVNNVGVPTADAVLFIDCGQSNSPTSTAEVSLLNYVTNTALNTANGLDLTVVPFRIASSLVGVNPQVFLTWIATPKMTPNVGTAVYIKAEIPDGTEFDLALIGSTPRHYIAVGNALRHCAYNGASTPLGAVMLWED